ncbi:three-helix bundle dimerization domain-containing protein [Rhodococcus sp. UFZ-B548]|uniref:three-helix bundle dimerization domain-containing protein n=1 Tax=Rhodococcus sp. UFZ-B548 TaxID=2742212 RepID=UPI0037CB4AD5
MNGMRRIFPMLDMMAILVMSVLSEPAAFAVRVIRTPPHSQAMERSVSSNIDACTVPSASISMKATVRQNYPNKLSATFPVHGRTNCKRLDELGGHTRKGTGEAGRHRHPLADIYIKSLATFPATPVNIVDAAVAEAYHRFDSAQVRDFVAPCSSSRARKDLSPLRFLRDPRCAQASCARAQASDFLTCAAD